MDIADIRFSSANSDELAEKLTTLYIQKCAKSFTDPKEFTRFFVDTKRIITAELVNIRKNG